MMAVDSALASAEAAPARRLRQAQWLALLLFVLALPPFGFFVTPLLARTSRRHEFEADAYACRQADGGALASALLKLHEDNAATLTPDPVYVSFYYSHPPASQRLAALPPPRGAGVPASA